MMSSTNNGQQGTGRVSRPVSAMPEALTREDRDTLPWRVEEGLPIRGDAYTNLDDRVMRVPYGLDESSRVIRAHEMTHAKVSPSADVDAIAKACSISPSMIRAVEELRVNLLVASAGFDVDLLVDGSERMTGERLARSEAIRPLVEMAIGTLFTKAHAELLKGVRSVRPDLADSLDHLCGDVVEQTVADRARYRGNLRGRVAKRNRARRYGDALRRSLPTTNLVLVDPLTLDSYRAPSYELTKELRERVVEIPNGFHFTLELARIVDSLITSTSPNGDSDATLPPRPEWGNDTRRGYTVGAFAPLVWDRGVSLNRWVPNVMGRRRVRTTSGIVPRRVDLLLTDPDRRIFSREVRSTGGVVLIDQSGSMSLSVNDVERLVEASSGCVVIGYSHRPRSSGVPNIWTLADRGRIASRLRDGNGGNGCDAPALDHAISIRRGSEPIVWVCDGYVTYSDDTFAGRPDRLELLRRVRRHGVHMVNTVDEAIDALRQASTGRLRPQYTTALAQGIENEAKEMFS